jgi:hypothetical protein
MQWFVVESTFGSRHLENVGLMLHRSPDLLIRQRAALVKALHGHFTELGIVVGQGIGDVPKPIVKVTAASLERVPESARAVLGVLATQLGAPIGRSCARPRPWTA